jgi:ankyrin repeat protein
MSNKFWISLTKEIIQLFEDRETDETDETEETEETETEETETDETELDSISIYNNDEFVDPFHNACHRGNVEMVQKYLNDGIDPSKDQNLSIQIASEFGHIEIVELLLQDTKNRVDPSASNNYAIRYACANGHISVVDRLLQDERVDPSADRNHALQLTCHYMNRLDIVNLLLQDSRVDPFDENNQAMCLASLYGDINVVNRLLQEMPKYPLKTINIQNVIRYASEEGHTKIVNRLRQFV